MKMAVGSTQADQDRVRTMMAQRRTLNPNVRRMAPTGVGSRSDAAGSTPAAPPKPAWQQLREQGIAGQGSAAANKAALGMGGGSGPIMAPDQMHPGGGMAPRPMTPEVVAQAQQRPGGGMAPSGFKPGQPSPPGMMGDQISVENQNPGSPWDAARMGGAAPAGGGFEGPGNGMPPGIGGLPPEIMQRLQSLRSAQGGLGGPQPYGGGLINDPSGGRGFVPPGQGASGAAPRPYGLQSFYGA